MKIKVNLNESKETKEIEMQSNQIEEVIVNKIKTRNFELKHVSAN